MNTPYSKSEAIKRGWHTVTGIGEIPDARRRGTGVTRHERCSRTCGLEPQIASVGRRGVNCRVGRRRVRVCHNGSSRGRAVYGNRCLDQANN